MLRSPFVGIFYLYRGIKMQKIEKMYVCYRRSTYTRRVHLIPSALDSPMSQLSNARFPGVFKPVLTSLGHFEVVKLTWFGHKHENILPISGYENPKNRFFYVC